MASYIETFAVENVFEVSQKFIVFLLYLLVSSFGKPISISNFLLSYESYISRG